MKKLAASSSFLVVGNDNDNDNDDDDDVVAVRAVTTTATKTTRRRASSAAAISATAAVALLLLLSATTAAVVTLSSSVAVVVMAVDHSKFRTCQQTSFCRRHRDNHSSRLYKYRLVSDSVRFHIPQQEDGQQDAAAAAAAEADVAAAGGGVWKSFQRRLFGDDEEGGGNENRAKGDDPHVRGPPPTLTGTLQNTAAETSSGLQDERLRFTVSAMSAGVVRMRITEDYGQSGTAYERARVTYDDLVLEESTMKPAEHADWVRDVTDLAAWKHHSAAVDKTAAAENFMALRYGDKPPPADNINNEDAAAATGMILLVRMQPFSVYLYRESNVRAGPVIVMGTEDMMHFEVRRSKDVEDSVNKAAAAAAAAGGEDEKGDDTKKEGEVEGEEEKKPEKEIVGYWEDGLAIYADGTREEKKDDKEAEDEDHRKLTVEELDREGLWEESFGSHKDTKPVGPASVGMDIAFPSSRHLYGIPEHAASAVLQTTAGDGAHFKDPYRLYNLDVFEYDLDETMALYGHVPLMVSHSTATGTAGVFWFNPTETFVDVMLEEEKDDATTTTTTSVTHWLSESGVVDVFLLPGPNPAALYGQYAALTGTAPVPPMFSLGYHQCRWNYKDEKDVREVHGRFEDLDYPYDVLWLDIEHTDGKRYFTWDAGLFPDPKRMIEALAAQGRKMVTIIDPHIKRDDKYYIHKEATDKGLYIKDKDGNADYDGWCWPGSSSYLDFTAAHVRSWWADQFRYDRYQGSTRTLYTWNDMNEPSVFNGPEVSMQKDLKNLNGEEHREWHNLYGMLFHRATGEGLVRRNQRDEHVARPFVLSRAFFAGSQKYGAIWTGDNKAEWSHLEIAAPMLLSMNAAALSFVGADVGGFFGNPDAELFTRWMQAAAYQPFFRGHAHHDSARREPWMFDDDTLDRLRRASMTRYALLPFWYTVFRHAETTGVPVMRMMWMQYPATEALFAVDDQYLVGSDVLVKPVTKRGATETTVQFPTDHLWYDIETLRLSSRASIVPGGVETKTVPAGIDTVPAYQRGGSVLVRKLRLRRSTEMMKKDPYTLYVALDSRKKAAGQLYMDDEFSFAYKRSHQYATANFDANLSAGGAAGTLRCSVSAGSGWSAVLQSLAPDRVVERIVVAGLDRQPKAISVKHGSTAAAAAADQDQDLEFHYVSDAQMLVVRRPEVSALLEWEILFSW